MFFEKTGKNSGVPSDHPGSLSDIIASRWVDYLALLIIVLLTFVVYSPAINGGFIWDDDFYVSRNPLLAAPDGLWRIWRGGETVQYYPMVFTTFWVEHRLWGLNPTGYHIVNVALHAINAILFWFVLHRLGVKWAWLAGMIFALHPVHVESVAWITERKNVLSGMFYLLAASSYLSFISRSKWVWYVAALVFFLLALLSKTVTSSLPVVLLFILWLQQKKVSLKDIGLLIPFLIAGLVMGLLTVWYEAHSVGAVGSEWDLSFLQRFLIAGRALWFYVIKLVWPAKLTFIYPRWEIDVSDLWQWVWPLGFIAVAAGFWFFREKVGRGPIVSLAFFSVTLSPALGFFDVYPMRFSFVADHFQYLASMGVIALIVGGVARGFEQWDSVKCSTRGRTTGMILGLVVLVIFGMLTWKQGYAYRDLETLWKDTIKKNPTAWMAHNNLGIIYQDRGELRKASDAFETALELKPDYSLALKNLGRVYFERHLTDEAIEKYRKALQINPDHLSIHNDLGNAYLIKGEMEEALKEFKTIINIVPSNKNDFYIVDAHYNLGRLYHKQGRINDAIKEYKITLELKPDHIGAHHNLGLGYSKQGRIDDAIKEYQMASKISPDHAGIRSNLGVAYFSRGLLDDALKEFQRVVEIEPDSGDAHYNLGNIYQRKGMFNEAIIEYKKVLNIDSNVADVHYNLGVIYAKNGLLDQAKRKFQKALEIDPYFKEAERSLQDILNR